MGSATRKIQTLLMEGKLFFVARDIREESTSLRGFELGLRGCCLEASKQRLMEKQSPGKILISEQVGTNSRSTSLLVLSLAFRSDCKFTEILIC